MAVERLDRVGRVDPATDLYALPLLGILVINPGEKTVIADS